jgi:hypothetical protein
MWVTILGGATSRIPLFLNRKRGKLRGDGMILRFPDRGESDSFWEWCRLPILTVCRMPS